MRIICNVLRYLQAQRRIYGKRLGHRFIHRINDRIELSWNSIYNYYKKCEETQRLEREERRKRRLESRKAADKGKGKRKGDKKGRKGGKSKGSSSTELSPEEKIQQWCTLRSQPKKRYPPAPLPPRKKGDLAKLQARLPVLAKPKFVYVKPSEDPDVVNLFKVNPKALTYIATDNIKLLAQPPESRLIKEEIPEPGAVKPSALTYVATPNIIQMATPKKRSAAPGESEVKQDAFQVSPAALKYVATPRILDLARPVERT